MTTYILKLIALIAMVVDHTAVYLDYSGSPLTPSTINIMRAVGRISLPIFAFCIVIGFSKTNNLKKYIGRIHIFALLSQIPFVLAANPINYIDAKQIIGGLVPFEIAWKKYIFVALIVFSYYYYICAKKYDKSIVWVTLAYAIAPISLRVNDLQLLIEKDLNIFYDLGISLILMAMIERAKYLKNISILQTIVISIFIFLNYYYVASISNYMFAAILLILGLKLADTQRIGQVAFICFWAASMYSWSLLHMICAMLAGLVIYFYNGNKGPSIKYIFYVFYPAHLILLALLNILTKLNLSGV